MSASIWMLPAIWLAKVTSSSWSQGISYRSSSPIKSSRPEICSPGDAFGADLTLLAKRIYMRFPATSCYWLASPAKLQAASILMLTSEPPPAKLYLAFRLTTIASLRCPTPMAACARITHFEFARMEH